MKNRRTPAIETVHISREHAELCKRRYFDIFQYWARSEGHFEAISLEKLLLSVYTQGVMDGVQMGENKFNRELRLKANNQQPGNIMHYKNGREAKVGDTVIGTTYNRKGTQVGKLVGITPGSDTCNARVALIDALPCDASSGNMGRVHVEHGADGPQKPDLLVPNIDYTDCGSLLHADDAWSMAQPVMQSGIVGEVAPPPPVVSGGSAGTSDAPAQATT